MTFETLNDLTTEIERAFGQGLPGGWSWQRESDVIPTWLFRSKTPQTMAPDEDYRLQVRWNDRLLIVLHDNTDAGCLGVQQIAQTATIIELESLKFVSLDKIIRHIVDHHRPNQWGLT